MNVTREWKIHISWPNQWQLRFDYESPFSCTKADSKIIQGEHLTFILV